mgnify:CR=1 FL=1
MDELFNEINEFSKNSKITKYTHPCKIYGSPQDMLFIIYYKNFLTNAIANQYFCIFEQNLIYNSAEKSKIKICGIDHNIPRKQVAYGSPGTFYNFSGIKVNAISWNDKNNICVVLSDLRSLLKKYFNCDFNFVLINRYANGNDHIGYHSDDENDLVPNSPIVGITLGAERDFKFKNIENLNNFQFDKSDSLLLHHGSCIAINFPTNHYWKHGIPKRSNVKSPRISLTFRMMKILT